MMSPVHIGLALLTVAIWGVNFVVIKLGLADMPPILFAALRFILAAVPAVFFAPRPKVRLVWLAAYGWLQFALQFPLIFIAIDLGVGPGLASLLVQAQAFFTMGLAGCILGETVRPAQLAGALIAGAGLAWAGFHLGQGGNLPGFLLILAAALCWAGANIVTRRMGPVDALPLVAWGSLIAAPPLALAAWLMEGESRVMTSLAHMGLGGWLAVLFQSFANTLLGFGVWALLIRRYSASAVAPFSLLVPVTGMAAAAIVLGETITGWKIGAAALVIGGLAWAQFAGRSNKSAVRN